MPKMIGYPLECFEAINKALADESDRARVLLVAGWIDEFLKVKLMNEYSKGNSRAREQLFSANGPFATFSGKVNAAFCAGWIDQDVYHDIEIIRKLRNECAHSINPVSLEDEKFREMVEKLRVPRRQYFDWGKFWIVSTGNSFVFYPDAERPADTQDKLHVPGKLTFKLACSAILGVLAANLEIPFMTDDPDTAAIIKLPAHMVLPKDLSDAELAD